jgi:hypothetical protein
MISDTDVQAAAYQAALHVGIAPDQGHVSLVERNAVSAVFTYCVFPGHPDPFDCRIEVTAATTVVIVTEFLTAALGAYLQSHRSGG